MIQDILRDKYDEAVCTYCLNETLIGFSFFCFVFVTFFDWMRTLKQKQKNKKTF